MPVLLNFALWQNPRKPVSPRQLRVMCDVQLQLTKSKNYFDRAQLKVLYKDIQDLVDKGEIASADSPLIAKFAKNYKVNWQDLIMLLGPQLNNPVDVFLAYYPTKYMKEFVKKFNIPMLDLSDDLIWNRLENAVYDGRTVKFIKDQVALLDLPKTATIIERDEEADKLVLTNVALAVPEEPKPLASDAAS